MEGLEGAEEEGEEEEEEGGVVIVATPWGEDFFLPFDWGATTWAYVRRGLVGS